MSTSENLDLQEIRTMLQRFQDDHWPLVQRVALCEQGRDAIEVYRACVGAAVPLAPQGEAETWRSILAAGKNGSPFVLRSEGAAVLALPIRGRWTLVADCPIGGRFAVVAVLMTRLAAELSAVLKGEEP